MKTKAPSAVDMMRLKRELEFEGRMSRCEHGFEFRPLDSARVAAYGDRIAQQGYVVESFEEKVCVVGKIVEDEPAAVDRKVPSDIPVPHVRSSETSVAAAKSLKSTIGARSQAIYDLINEHPEGLTCEQVEIITGGLHQSVSAIIKGLRDLQFIEFSGEQRRNRTGRMAKVYVSSGAKLIGQTPDRSNS